MQNEIERLEQKIDAIYTSVEKTRKYFLWTLVITIVTILLPFVALLFVVPWVLNMYTSSLNGLL